MAKIIDFEMKRDGWKRLAEFDDPCTQCRQQPFCVETCQRASDWWQQFGEKFRKRCITRKLGVPDE